MDAIEFCTFKEATRRRGVAKAIAEWGAMKEDTNVKRDMLGDEENDPLAKAAPTLANSARGFDEGSAAQPRTLFFKITETLSETLMSSLSLVGTPVGTECNRELHRHGLGQALSTPVIATKILAPSPSSFYRATGSFTRGQHRGTATLASSN